MSVRRNRAIRRLRCIQSLFEYNEEDQLYYRYQDGKKQIDEMNKEQLAVSNVVSSIAMVRCVMLRIIWLLAFTVRGCHCIHRRQGNKGHLVPYGGDGVPPKSMMKMAMKSFLTRGNMDL